MTSIPSVTAQIDQKEIFNVISNNFSKLAPASVDVALSVRDGAARP